jgi:hypothetical protein
VQALRWTYHKPRNCFGRTRCDMNPEGFVVDLSMRSVRNSIWGWIWRSWPDYSLPSCALATDTPPPTTVVILWSMINQTTRVIPASNRVTKQEQVEQATQLQIWRWKTNLNSQSWGSESNRTDGLVNTHVYKEVAMAKLDLNKTQSVCGGSNPY